MDLQGTWLVSEYFILELGRTPVNTAMKIRILRKTISILSEQVLDYPENFYSIEWQEAIS
jgi:hypothetical protein